MGSGADSSLTEVSCTFQRNFDLGGAAFDAGMAEYLPGMSLRYRLGFNIYQDALTGRVSWAYQQANGEGKFTKQDSLTGKYQYPYEFERTQVEELEGDAGLYKMQGAYQVSLLGPTNQVL